MQDLTRWTCKSMSMAAARDAAWALLLAAVGCATASSDVDLRPDGSAGSAGAGVAGSAPSAGSGNSSAGSGQAGAPITGGAPGAAGAGGSPAGSGGTPGSSGSAGAGNTGPVTVGLPYSEDFESGSIKPNLWTAVAKQVPDATNAKWSVVTDGSSKVLRLDSDGTERFLVGGNSAWTDQKLELEVKVVSGDPEINVAFRYHALKDYYYLELADSKFKLRDRVGTNEDVQPTGDKPAVVVGTWYKLALQIKGTAVSASLDGVVIASGSFPSMPIASGGIAIGVGSGSGVLHFDNIKVTAP